MTTVGFILVGAICFLFAPEVVSAMECKAVLGATYSCPTSLDDKDAVFCCETGALGVQKCCDVEEFLKENTGIVAGIVIGAVVLLLFIILCCCCFCSCCCLAQRRQRGHVLYGPVGAQVVTPPSVTYQFVNPVNPLPATTAYTHSPPPYSPNNASHLPMDPYYK